MFLRTRSRTGSGSNGLSAGGGARELGGGGSLFVKSSSPPSSPFSSIRSVSGNDDFSKRLICLLDQQLASRVNLVVEVLLARVKLPQRLRKCDPVGVGIPLDRLNGLLRQVDRNLLGHVGSSLVRLASVS